jgi:surface protein
MFNKCSSLEELDLSNFNTGKVNNMNYMFSECSSLKRLNICNFTRNLFGMIDMFFGCPLLKELNNPDFNSLLYKDNK